MKILAVFLILAAAALLGLGVLRTYGLVLHNRQRKRKGKSPRRLDPFTRLVYLSALVFLALGVICASIPVPEDIPAETRPPETTPKETTPDAPDRPGYGWQDRNGLRYYRNPDGTDAQGWLEVDGQRYYFGADGAMHTGWLELEGSRYYFGPDGAMAVGAVTVEGETRFFTAGGTEILMVNPWNPVPAGCEPDLVDVEIYYGKEGLRIDSGCYAALKEMIDACNATGSRAYVMSAYRSIETQQRLFDQKVRSLLSQFPTRAEAEAEAATVVARPGTSEHHLGLAVDIIDTRLWALDERQADLPGQQWLMEHCWEYGFIFRYPRDKQAVTGIIFEPWHYRYVGKDLAAQLHRTGQTLEEYLESLS